MTAPAFQLTAPTGVTVQPGASGTFEVANTGTQPLVVHESLGRLTAGAVRYPAADHATLTAMTGPWVKVSPGTFRLAPGQHQVVHIAAEVPAGVQGDHYLTVIWSAQPEQASGGNVHLAGGIGTTVTVPLAGAATPAVSATGVARAPLAAQHGNGGISSPALAIGLLILAVMAVTVFLVARRSRRTNRGNPWER